MLARKSCIGALGLVCSGLSFGQSILSLSSGSGAPCSSVTLNISLDTAYPESSAGLQWTLNAPSPEVTSFRTTVGPGALAAQKSLYCANQTCLLVGLPQVHLPWRPEGATSIPLSNGVVASVTLTLSPTATGNLAIQFSNPVEALLDGTAGSITTADGIVNVTPNSVRAPPAGMTLCPTAVSVGADETQQFTANFTDGSNTAITWSLDPAIGTIKDGVFTAPVLIPKPEPSSVTVTATSVADPTKSATAVITLVPFQFKKGQ
jgi:hypothetical protein